VAAAAAGAENGESVSIEMKIAASGSESVIMASWRNGMK
jgi:hypothetical protein